MFQSFNLFPTILMFLIMGIFIGVISAFTSHKRVRRRNTREYYIELEKKGREYEAFVAEHYSLNGYTVTERGKNLKRKDKGIDLIAEKNGKTLFIQCKNWTGSVKVDHRAVKELFSNGTILEKELGLSDTELVIAVPSRDSIARSAVHEIKRMQQSGVNIQYKVVR